MKNKNLFMLLISMVIIGLLPMAVSASSWTSFQGNNENNGVTDENITTTFAENWTSTTVAGLFSGLDSGAVIDDNNVTYCVAYNGSVYAFGLMTGSEIWKNTNIGNNDSLSSELSVPAYNNDRLYVGLTNGSTGNESPIVYALNATNGNVVWDNNTYIPSDQQLNSPIKYDDSGKLYFGSVKVNSTTWETEDGYFYCVDASNGHLIWRYHDTPKGYYGAAPAIIGNYVVVGDDAGIVRSFNKEDGTLVDTLNTSTYGSIRSGIVYNDGSLYYSTTGGYLVKVSYNSSTGDIEGNTLSNEDIGSRMTSTPAVTDDYIYVGTDSSEVIAINKTAVGNSTYDTYYVNGPVKASPVVTTYPNNNKERVYVTTNIGLPSGTVGRCYWLTFDTVNEAFTINNGYWEPPGSTYTLHGIAFANGWLVYGNDGSYLYGATSF